MRRLKSLPPGLPSSLAFQKIQSQRQKRHLEKNFKAFIEYVFDEYYGTHWLHNWHHDLIIDLIARIEAREVPNAVINIPPRYGKTELAVILWICWVMIRNPRAQFIHVSYSLDLALKNSAQIREILRSPCIQKHWPIKMRDSADSKGLWLTEEGGGLKADAAGGSITGFGAGVTTWKDGEPFDGAIIIDDPLKPDDAQSDAERARVNCRLGNTLHSRKNHGKVPMVIIMQRLHVDDASGVALSGGVMGDTFEHLALPAMCDGEVLWEYKHTLDKLLAMQTADRATFAGQYQQEPFVAGGEVFNLEWFDRYNQVSGTADMCVHSWDTAYKKGSHNDPSSCTVWRVGKAQAWLAEDITRRMDYPELRAEILRLADRDSPAAILIEDKASGQALISDLTQNTSLPIIPIEPDGDKETRARAASYAVHAKKIVLPVKASWLADYEAELAAFPNGKHDDRVDSTSQFINWWMQQGGQNKGFNDMLKEIYGV